MTDAALFDAALAARILHANGSEVPADSLHNPTGYAAYLHRDLADALAWWRTLTDPYGTTLVAFGNVEGGWLYLYDTCAATRPGGRP